MPRLGPFRRWQFAMWNVAAAGSGRRDRPELRWRRPLQQLLTDLVLSGRNLMRNRRRSLAALAAVGFGVVALLLAAGFIEWIFIDMRESTIRSRLGHVQVSRPGYQEAGAANPAAYLLPPQSDLKDSLGRDRRVAAVGQRLSFSGLASRDQTTISFIGEGVEPDQEAALSTSLAIVAGEPLSAAAPTGAIFGRGLASNLGVEVGDTVVLLTNPDGGISAIEVKVRGVFTTVSKQFDDSALRLPIDSARRLMRTEGAHSWVVLLKDTGDTDAVLAQLRGGSREADGLVFTGWHELADFYRKTVALFGRQVRVVEFIIAVVIVLSIFNTMTMTVMERTGEVGTALALGVGRWRILRQFVLEGLLIGVVGAIIGAVVGWLLAVLLTAVGIPMPPPPGMARGYVAGVTVTPRLALDAIVMAAVAATIASLHPAWRVSRWPIIDALRHNR